MNIHKHLQSTNSILTISSKFNDFTARGSCAVTGLVRFFLTYRHM